ncbi:MAG: hypothetical protein PQJ60_04455, partial [Spirochaetales bacterium]|nr:hypothetical protein [Spirochaetales bacterium]
MRRKLMKSLGVKGGVLLLLLLVFGCTPRRQFKWTADLVQTLGGKDLVPWLQQSPFEGEWHAKESTKDVFYSDNIRQVFPFMAGFENENAYYRDYYNTLTGGGKLYEETKLVFKDPQFGESFVYAGLIYNYEELFIKSFYSEAGNPLFSQGYVSESYDSKLFETFLIHREENYKTALYWVESNNQTYLSGFYQKDRLIFQFAFPCEKDNSSRGLEKVREISRSLDLNVAEWEEAGVDSLEINPDRESFLKDPFLGVYHIRILPMLEIKFRESDFKQLKDRF